MSIDPTNGAAGNFSFLQPKDTPTGGSPDQGGGPTGLGGDQQSSNRHEAPLWSEQLRSIVNEQGSLSGPEASVDLSPFLALLEQSTGGAAKPGVLENDLKSFLSSEEKKSKHAGESGLNSTEFDSDLHKFLKSEDEKQGPDQQAKG